MNDEVVIRVENVYKDFILPHERSGSVKGIFTSMFSKATSKKEKQHALKDISFEIKKGEFLGIVGRNGSGKSTLLKILAQIYQPTKGKVSTKGKLVPFIELGVGFNPELSGRDNVYLNGAVLGFSMKEVDAMYDEIVEFAELKRFMDQKLKNYSSGMQVRLAFSMAIRSEAEILLIDEVLAVGDANFQRKCFEYFRTLKRTGTTVVFVTHDMNAVREYCDRAILIEDSHLTENGTPSKVAATYSRMFIETNNDEQESKKETKRWGDKAAVYTKVEVSPKKVTPETKEITISLVATAEKDIPDPNLGFIIKNASYDQISGTNTNIERQPVKSLKKGESIELEWKVPNIFNDGQHFLDAAIVYNGGSQISDWWEEASSFRVYREDKTPYLTSPSVEVSIKRKEN